MHALITSLYVLEVLVSVMLIGIVLIQQSKKQGGLGALAGGQTESVFGAATGNVITKTTVILATIFLANTLFLAVLTSQATRGKKGSTLADTLANDTTEQTQNSDMGTDDGSPSVDDGAEAAATGTDDESMDEDEATDSGTADSAETPAE